MYQLAIALEPMPTEHPVVEQVEDDCEIQPVVVGGRYK